MQLLITEKHIGRIDGARDREYKPVYRSFPRPTDLFCFHDAKILSHEPFAIQAVHAL